MPREFVTVPSFPVINDFEASPSCLGVFLDRANRDVPWDGPRPTTTKDDPAAQDDPGLSRFFLYDPIGQWVNLSDTEEYTDECDFYYCYSQETAQKMLSAWIGRPWQQLFPWKPIKDSNLSDFLGVEADWTNGYRTSDGRDKQLGDLVAKTLRDAISTGYDIDLWHDVSIAQDLTDLNENLRAWERHEIIPIIVAWRLKHAKNPHDREVFIHKDSSRRYYKIEVWDSGMLEYDPLLHSEGEGDKIWQYSISQEVPSESDSWFIIHQNRLVGQYEKRPKLRDVMADFMHYFTRLSLDIVAHEVSRGSNSQLVK